MNGQLIVRHKSQEKLYDLVGRCGYNINKETGTIRVWDEESTWVINLTDLVEFRVPNNKLGR